MRVAVVAVIGLVVIGVAVGLVVWLLQGGAELPQGPVIPVWDKDVCASCKMHVGEPAFAAQVQPVEGPVRYFDDPGCLFLYVDREKPKLRATYFRHHQQDRWIPVEQVAFLPVERTPMGFGLAAVDGGTAKAISYQEAVARVKKSREGAGAK